MKFTCQHLQGWERRLRASLQAFYMEAAASLGAGKALVFIKQRALDKRIHYKH